MPPPLAYGQLRASRCAASPQCSSSCTRTASWLPPCRQLELALVELARTGGQSFLALAALRRDFRLPLLEHLFACFELHACLRRLLFRLCEPVLALRKLFLERARLFFLGARLLLALFERLDQLLVARLRFRARCLDPLFGVREVFLALGEVLDLLLPLFRLVARSSSACFSSCTLMSTSCSRSAICASSFASFSSLRARRRARPGGEIWRSRSSRSASVDASAAARGSSARPALRRPAPAALPCRRPRPVRAATRGGPARGPGTRSARRGAGRRRVRLLQRRSPL